MKHLSNTIALVIAPIIMFNACQSKNSFLGSLSVTAPVPIRGIERANSFEMELNGTTWSPAVDPNDICRSSFFCDYSGLRVGEQPYQTIYTIKAYPDFKYRSDGKFVIRVVGVERPGTYLINEPLRGDHNPYVIFIDRTSDPVKIYETDPTHQPFEVKIEKMFPIPQTTNWKGIEGSFSGTLYNRDNPDDFLTITNGSFSFKKTNWRNFDHCIRGGE